MPDLQPVAASARKTAILVLDLSARCKDPLQPCSALLPAVGDFLEKARAAALPIVFTGSASAKERRKTTRQHRFTVGIPSL